METKAPTTGVLADELTVPDTEPADCALTGEASSTIADTTAMNPATGEMRPKLTCNDMGSSESEWRCRATVATSNA